MTAFLPSIRSLIQLRNQVRQPLIISNVSESSVERSLGRRVLEKRQGCMTDLVHHNPTDLRKALDGSGRVMLNVVNIRRYTL